MMVRILVPIVAVLATGCCRCSELMQPEEQDAAIAEYRKLFNGTWKGEGVTLAIDENGQVHYEKKTGASSKSIDLPIKSFEKHEFEVGFLGMNTTFSIVNGRPAMTVRLVVGSRLRSPTS